VDRKEDSDVRFSDGPSFMSMCRRWGGALKSQTSMGDFKMKRAFLFGLAVLIGACTQAPAPEAKSLNGTVDGVYRVDDKDVKLGFARSYKGEPFTNKPTIMVALTEKDSSDAKGPPMFWHAKYGGAIVINLMKNTDGSYDVISSTFLHPAAKDGGSNGTGIVSLKDVKDANGEIAGELVTKPDMTLFDQKLDIDLKFKVPNPS
jgi:hypothetical protein